MKRNLLLTVLTVSTAMSISAGDWIDEAARQAASQLIFQADAIDSPGKYPRALFTDYSIPFVSQQLEREPADFYREVELRSHPSLSEYLTVRYGNYNDWTSGFFPGSLWLAYELTGNEELKQRAVKITNSLLPVSHLTSTHDVGFMIDCSYGNAMRISPNDSIKEVIVRTADNLMSRYNPDIQCIRSWDFGEWNYPVIIDNMMNLQLLFNAWHITGDPRYRDVAVAHADKTMKCHFRDDYSCYHVVSYNNDGTVQSRGTFQGKHHESAWSRGQAWALYGYTDCYRETGERRYLDQACNIARMFMNRNATTDHVPYWDFDAIDAEDTPRDASAAAICASAMIELGTFVDGELAAELHNYGRGIVEALSTARYMAPTGENGGFVLKHSTGSLPHGSEIDTPLSYADYYYLEALNRLRRVDAGLPTSDWSVMN